MTTYRTRPNGAAEQTIKRAHENRFSAEYTEPLDGIIKFIFDSNRAAAKVGPLATSHDDFMRRLLRELVEMGYTEFA